MTYYDILEVSENASEDVIRMAYKALAKKYHPDVYKGDRTFADEKMKLLNESYDVLSDFEKRRNYDFKLHIQRQNTAGFAGQRHTYDTPPSYVPPTETAQAHPVVQVNKGPKLGFSIFIIILCLFLAFSDVAHPYIESPTISIKDSSIYGLRDFSLLCILMMTIPLIVGSVITKKTRKNIRWICAISSVGIWVLSAVFYGANIIAHPLIGWIVALLYYFINTNILLQIHRNNVGRKKALQWCFCIILLFALSFIGSTFTLNQKETTNPHIDSPPNESTSTSTEHQVIKSSKEDLLGMWSMKQHWPEDSTRSILENFDFYEEEIALVDFESFVYQETLIFTENNRYYIGIDPEISSQYAQLFFKGLFEDLYRNRTSLNAIYSTDFSAFSKEEFHNYYASLYQSESFEALTNEFVEGLYGTPQLGYSDINYASIEQGTFILENGHLSFSPDNGTSFAVEFEEDGSNLYLYHNDNHSKYTRSFSNKQMVAIRTITFTGGDSFSAEYFAYKALGEWEDGDRTEEQMISLMDEHGASQGGGKLHFVVPGMYVEAIDNWCFDPNRQVGDVRIIKNEYGYSLCYISIIF